jgi:hypothetical protein
VIDPAIRQRSLELLDAFVGDLRFAKTQVPKIGELLQVVQSGVCDSGAAEPKVLEVGFTTPHPALSPAIPLRGRGRGYI